jgi:hypothetical protein
MAKRGTKPKNNVVKINQGTDQPCRSYDELFENDPDEEIICPDWLNDRAKKIWDEKVTKYVKRGQSVSGCEDALAQYCALEADLIAKHYEKDITPPVAMVNAIRIWANEFFDTPASQLVKPGGKKTTNPFLKHGR